MAESSDLLAEYNALLSTLKKRFFRRVDYAGSAEQFLELANEMKRQGNQPYAAFCLTAVARCHSALNQEMMEAHYYLESGRLLWAEQLEMFDHEPSSFAEFVSEATHCYLLAIEIMQKNGRFALSSSLYSELATFLRALGKLDDAAMFFDRSCQLIERESPALALVALEESLACRLQVSDLAGALETINWMLAVATRESCPEHSSRHRSLTAAEGQKLSNLQITKILLMGLLGMMDDANAVLSDLETQIAADLTEDDTFLLVIPMMRTLLEANGQLDRSEAEKSLDELHPFLDALQSDLAFKITKITS